MNVSILLFSDNFLELRARSPKSHWVTVGFLVIWLLLIILIPVVSYLVIARLMIPTQLITIMATWVIGIVSWRRDFKSLRYFMVAWLGMAASLFWLSLVRLGIASSTNFSENMFQWGFIVMAVSWSFALAYRINLLKTTTENTARDLQKSERRLSQILEGLPVGVVVYGKDQKPAFINRWTVEMLSDPTQGIRPDISAGRTLEQAIDQFSFQVAGTEDKYPLEGMPVYRALHGEPASADDIAVNIKDGQVLLEVWASPIKDGEGKVESAVATIQDITSRKKVEAELEEHRRQLESLVRERTAEIDKINRDLQLRLDWLSMINKVHQRITGSTSLTQVYTDLSAEVLSLLEADLVVILRWDGHIDGLGVVTNLAKGVETLDENILYESFEKNSPLRKKIETFTPIIWSSGQSDPVPASIWDWFIAHNICDAVFTPMFVGQSVFGVLGVAASATQQNISIRQFDFVERVALDLSNLAQDADLLDKTMALVAMDERNRLAKDLHDSVTQVLFTATLLAEVLPQIWQKNPEQGLQSLEKLRKLTKGALAEMRTMLIELRPSAVLNTSLSELLAQLTEALTSRIGVQFRLFIEQVPILPDDVQVSFYRIAQEALNNVGKHAQALSVEVSLSESELPSTAEGMPGRMVRLVIQDDGVGFYPDNVKAGHMGIAIMRERANAIGADLLLKSEPGHGTIVSMTWRSDPEIGKQDG
jgi:signal transduction histidine kinase/PAS domain-containing protein